MQLAFELPFCQASIDKQSNSKLEGVTHMSAKRSFALAAAGVALLSLPVLAQEGGPENRSEASVQFFGTFVKSTVDKGVGQSASDSGGVLASYRYFFTSHQGVEVNYGYSRSTQS